MAKKKSKGKKRPVAKAKRTAAKAKASKKTAAKKSSKAKTAVKAKVAKKSAKPATKKAKSIPVTKTAKKKVAKKKVMPPVSVAATPAPIVEPPSDSESAPISEPTSHDVETSA